MGFTVEKLPIYDTTSLNSYVNSDLFNENAGRIIALATLKNNSQFQFHFYLRNGNGTCQNPNHYSICSIWTGKMGSASVDGPAVLGCDSTIEYVICNEIFGYNNCYSTYYDISKTTNTYNTWYYYNHNDNNTGTQFVYNT